MGGRKMKEYLSPEIEIIATSNMDICTASPGTEAPKTDLDGGMWNW